MAKARSTSTKATRTQTKTKEVAPVAQQVAAPATAATAARPAKQKKTTASSQPQVVMRVGHDEIARKAYEIWLAKGRPHGQDEQNWREAEAALQTEQAGG